MKSASDIKVSVLGLWCSPALSFSFLSASALVLSAGHEQTGDKAHVLSAVPPCGSPFRDPTQCLLSLKRLLLASRHPPESTVAPSSGPRVGRLLAIHKTVTLTGDQGMVCDRTRATGLPDID